MASSSPQHTFSKAPWLYYPGIYHTWLLSACYALDIGVAMLLPRPNRLPENLGRPKTGNIFTTIFFGYPLAVALDLYVATAKFGSANIDDMDEIAIPATVLKYAIFCHIWTFIPQVIYHLWQFGVRFPAMRDAAASKGFQLVALFILIFTKNMLPCQTAMEVIHFAFIPVDSMDENNLIFLDPRYRHGNKMKVPCLNSYDGDFITFHRFAAFWAVFTSLCYIPSYTLLRRMVPRYIAQWGPFGNSVLVSFMCVAGLISSLAVVLYFDLYFHHWHTLLYLRLLSPSSFMMSSIGTRFLDWDQLGYFCMSWLFFWDCIKRYRLYWTMRKPELGVSLDFKK